MTFNSFLLALRSAILKVFVFWVLLFATYLALGRQFFPLIYKFEPEIEQWLSGQFEKTVSIGSVQGNWARFGPVVILTDVNIGDDLTIEEMVLAPGIFESLSHGGLSFLQFELSHFNGHLFQSEQGWQLAGLKSNENTERGTFDIDKLLQLLQRQKNIQFSELSLTISPLELPSFDLILNTGQLSGYKGSNGLNAEAQIDYLGLSVPIELQVETNQYQPKLNKLYLKHGQFDFSPWLNKVSERIDVASGSGEYWVNFDGSQWGSLTGRLKLDELIVSGVANPFNVTSVSTELFVERDEQGLDIKGLLERYSINGRSFENTELVVNKASDSIQIAWNQLPASLVGAWLSLDDTSGFWPAFNMRGTVDNGSIHIGLGEDQGFSLTSDFSDTQVDPHFGIPGLTNLNGQLTVEGRQGMVEVNPTVSTVSLPIFYDHSLTAEIESSVVRWQVVEGIGVLLDGQHEALISDKTRPDLAVLPIETQWYTSIKNSYSKSLGYEDILGLSLYSERVNQDWIKYITDINVIGDVVSEFVDKNIQQAVASEVGFSYSSIGSQDQRQSQIDLFANLAQTNITFLDDWKALTDVSGQLSLNEGSLSLDVEQANYQAFKMDRGRLDLDFNTGDLLVDFSTYADASHLLNLFKTGPLSELVSEVINDWQADGTVHSDVNLAVNLNDTGKVNVTTLSDIEKGRLYLSDLDLEFENINGLLQFNSDTGLLAENIDLKHAGLAQTITIDSELVEDNLLVTIYSQGQTSLAYWGAYFSDPYLSGIEEDVSHQTKIRIQDSHVDIDIQSDFLGVELNLPAPFNKTAKESWPTNISIALDEFNWKTINFSTQELAEGYVELDEKNLVKKATFAVNQAIEIHNEPGIFIDITADQVDGSGWWQTIQDIGSLYRQRPTSNTQTNLAVALKRINLNIRSGDYLGRHWSEANVQVFRNDDAWLANFEALEGVGTVLIPHDDAPVFADLEWLNIDTESRALPLAEQIDPLTDYQPIDVPNIELQIKKLIWNNQDMGDWRAKINVDNDRLNVKSLVGTMPGAVLTGELEWRVEEGEHTTKFTGVVESGDVLTVLNEWEYAPVLTSRDGYFDADLYWLGSPAFFDFKRLQGKINLLLTKGAILKVEEYEGIKLIGLLNFTRVLQRIALDFSDLLGSGISFDTIEGELLFDRGFARVGEKLVIDGASTNFRFSGDADLLSNIIDIDMVLTVPLSSTFPLVALLAGVSPQAAAAIYVTERVFNNELKKISSARMHITGSFEEPIIKFYRVFDDQIGAEDQSVSDRLKNVVPETANP